MTKAKPPCKANGVDCRKRQVGCHEHCPEYADYQRDHNAQRAIVFDGRRRDNLTLTAATVKRINEREERKARIRKLNSRH